MNDRCEHCGVAGYAGLCPTCADRNRRRTPATPLGHSSWKALVCPYCGMVQRGVVGGVFDLTDVYDPHASRTVETHCDACRRPFRAHVEHVAWMTGEPIDRKRDQ